MTLTNIALGIEKIVLGILFAIGGLGLLSLVELTYIIGGGNTEYAFLITFTVVKTIAISGLAVLFLLLMVAMELVGRTIRKRRMSAHRAWLDARFERRKDGGLYYVGVKKAKQEAI